MGCEKPSYLRGGRSFEVFGETSTSAEPCECAFDDPAPGQELEAFDAGWPLDDLDCPGAAVGNCIDELFAAINPVGKDVPQLWEAIAQVFQ